MNNSKKIAEDINLLQLVKEAYGDPDRMRVDGLRDSKRIAAEMDLLKLVKNMDRIRYRILKGNGLRDSNRIATKMGFLLIAQVEG